MEAKRSEGAGREPAGPGRDPAPPRNTHQEVVVDDDGVTIEERRYDTETRQRVDQRNYVVARVTQVVDYLFYLLYGLMGMRFLLALVGANQAAGFVQFVNGITQPFYAPFSGIVSRPAVNGGFFDFPLLIAVLAYVVLHVALRGLLRLLMTHERTVVRRP
jgi:uncharacterized protein YggT (Ycf19 family)